MKKFISYFTFALCAAVTLVSCNKEDGGGDGFDGIFDEKDGYIEVTIDEKTYKSDVEIWNAGRIREWGKEILCEHDNFADFYDYGFDIYFRYIRYGKIENLLNCPLGEYPFGYQEEYENFTFEIESYDSPSLSFSSYECSKGTHKVTSIKRRGDKVVVEGTFESILGYSEYGETSEDNMLPIKGKYQIAFDNIED